jgi:hypothetical protein
MLVMSLFPGPAAHAGDGGLLDDATDVVGAVTNPSWTRALETVQTVVAPVEQAVQPAVEHAVEPTVSEVENAVDRATGDDGGAPPAGEAPAQREDDGPNGGRKGGPDVQAAEPVTASQPAAATTTPSGEGSGHGTGESGPGDAPGNAAADRSRAGQRASAASCDAISGLPLRGAAAPVVQLRRDVRDAEVAGPGGGVEQPDDRSDDVRAFVLPKEGGPAPALVDPDAVRALWLTGLVVLVLMLAAGLTVVLVRELE